MIFGGHATTHPLGETFGPGAGLVVEIPVEGELFRLFPAASGRDAENTFATTGGCLIISSRELLGLASGLACEAED
jgi:hypothetical protein